MIGKIMKAASFSRCVHYVTGKEEARILASDGVLLTTTQDIIDSFEFQRQMNPRISKPVGHIALSFLPEDRDKLTDEIMLRRNNKGRPFFSNRQGNWSHRNKRLIMNIRSITSRQ